MKVYLVAGNNAGPIKEALEKGGRMEIVRCGKTLQDAFHSLVDSDFDFEVLLLIDQGIGNSVEDFAENLRNFRELVDNLFPGVLFKFITKEPQYSQIFARICGDDSRFRVHFVQDAKIPISLLKDMCFDRGTPSCEKTQPLYEFQQPAPSEQAMPRRFHLFQKTEPDKAPVPEPDPIPASTPFPVHHGINKSSANGPNRVLAFTGHRGSGVTGTVSNVALAASIQGLSTFIVDLDLLYRGINLYFSKFGDEVDLNPELACSLVKCLMKPDSYSINSCTINDNLMLCTIAHSVDHSDKILEFINTRRLITFVTILKTRFNLILLDLPLEYLAKHSDLLFHIDSVGLCLNNSIYSLLNTVKSTCNSLNPEDLTLFGVKAKFILTKYINTNTHQGRSLTPALVSNLLCSISDAFDARLDCAGIVPFTNDYDGQIDSGKKLCSTRSDLRDCYNGIIKNLM